MPSPRTTTTYAVLGLLSVRDWTTYELAKQVRRSLNWFWPRAERRLYDEPKRLVADGLATATREATGKRPRTVYSITDQGRAELARWLGLPAEQPSSELPAMLKVFFADAGSLEQLVTTLDGMEAEAAARLEALADLAATGAEQPVFPARVHLSALSLRLQLEQELTVLRWARRARRDVTTWSSTTDPGDWDAAGDLRGLADEARKALRA
jgi:DNA-binding PadR family transcriptional regulator